MEIDALDEELESIGNCISLSKFCLQPDTGQVVAPPSLPFQGKVC